MAGDGVTTTKKPQRRTLMPLSDFPPEKRAQIEYLASQPTAPPRYIDFGIAMIDSRAYYEWNLRKKRERKKARRYRIADRDGWICGICGLPIEEADLHIDHITPMCQGGKSDPSNLQAAHSKCNLKKGGR